MPSWTSSHVCVRKCSSLNAFRMSGLSSILGSKWLLSNTGDVGGIKMSTRNQLPGPLHRTWSRSAYSYIIPRLLASRAIYFCPCLSWKCNWKVFSLLVIYLTFKTWTRFVKVQQGLTAGETGWGMLPRLDFPDQTLISFLHYILSKNKGRRRNGEDTFCPFALSSHPRRLITYVFSHKLAGVYLVDCFNSSWVTVFFLYT